MRSTHHMITLRIFKTMLPISAIRKLKNLEYKYILKQKNAKKMTLVMKKASFFDTKKHYFFEWLMSISLHFSVSKFFIFEIF